MAPAKILVSAGEASGDRYCAGLVHALRACLGSPTFFGCAGPHMQDAGVVPIVDAASLAVVGLVEVLHHIPRLYGEYRKLIRAAREQRPDLAILTDSPDFHLRLAPHLRRLGIPVVYLVAPQVWAWREGRIGTLRRNVNQLHCIFPFEEQYFRDRNVAATYIGHPLSRLVRAGSTRRDFLLQHGIDGSRPVVVVCPGSRRGEMERHLPLLEQAAAIIRQGKECDIVVALPPGARIPASPIGPVILGQTWDALAHADLGLLASGTVTVEAALLGLPFVSFYRLSPLSWFLGRRFVRAPHLTMVNIIANRTVVPELMQDQATPRALASAALGLLADPAALDKIRSGLEQVAAALNTPHDPLDYSAQLIAREIIRN